MKTMYKKTSALIIVLILLAGACTDKFEDLNVDKRRVTDEQLYSDYYFVGGFFPQIQQMIYCNFNWGWGTNWPYQVMQNLNADIFSGYMMTPSAFNGGVNNTTYFLMDGWNASAWDYTYAYFMTAVQQVEEITEVDYPNFYATALILKVAGMHRISDLYGPIIYTNYGDSETGGQYDSQQEAYNAFFTDLSTAVDLLDEYILANPGAKPFEKYDQLFGGDYEKWIQFANSLRLRLAIRISKVAPTKAQEEGEAAMLNSYGVLETDIAQVSGKGYTNPVAAISNSWGDIKMGAPMESILRGYNDPRLSKYFSPTEDADAIGAGYDYKGIRQGIELPDNTTYRTHSSVNLTTEAPGILMTAAEVYLLRAEGALRGWTNMGGTAESLYEDGIQASMDQWGASIGDYLTSTDVAAAYVDVKNAANNVDLGSEYLNNVSPEWDEAATDEIKLQKIITQKWIATFPEGMEAWSEIRRTGYPKIFPVVINNSGGTISTTEFIKRLNFSVSEVANNPVGYANAVTLLGDNDDGGTALWWDVD